MYIPSTPSDSDKVEVNQVFLEKKKRPSKRHQLYCEKGYQKGPRWARTFTTLFPRPLHKARVHSLGRSGRASAECQNG